MIVGIACLVLLAIIGFGGRYGARILLRRRNAARDRELRIAAGNLEGIDVELPPLQGSEEEKHSSKAKRGRFQRFIFGGGYAPGLTIWQRDRFHQLARKVDSLLRNAQDLRDTTKDINRLADSVKTASEAVVPASLDEQSVARWWGSAVEIYKRRRVLGRQYWLSFQSYAPLLRALRERKTTFNEPLLLAKGHDISFLPEEEKLALDTARLVVPALDFPDNVNVPVVPSEPLAEAESVDLAKLTAAAQQAHEAAEAIKSQPAKSQWDYSRKYRIEDAESKAESAQQQVEEAKRMQRAAELAEQLPELVQTMVSETKAAMRVYKSAQGLSSEASELRSKGITAPQPQRPIEEDVKQYIDGALDWLARVEMLESQLPNACTELSAATDKAAASVEAVCKVLGELKALEFTLDIVYDDEVQARAAASDWNRDRFSADDRRPVRELGVRGVGVAENRLVGRFDDDRSPLATTTAVKTQSRWSKLLWFGGSRPAEPVQPVVAQQEQTRRSYGADEIGSYRGGDEYRHGYDYRGGYDRPYTPLTGDRSGSSLYGSLAKPADEPAYEKPKAPRLRKRWFLTDQAQAFRDAAEAAVNTCNSNGLHYARQFLRSHQSEPKPIVRAGANDAVLRSEIMSALRKLGFAFGQLNAASAKVNSLAEMSWETVPDADDRTADPNAYVQAVRTMRAEQAKQSEEKAQREQQQKAASEQVSERKKQVAAARDALATYLQAKDLFEPDVSSSLASLVRVVRVLLMSMDSNLSKHLKSKADKERDRLEEQRRLREAEERRRRDEEDRRRRDDDDRRRRRQSMYYS